MKKYLIIIVLFCFSCFIYSQSTIQKRIRTPKSQAAFSMDILEFSKNRFLLFGSSFDSVQSGVQSDLTLILVDEFGNTIWRKSYFDSLYPASFYSASTRLIAKVRKNIYSINVAFHSNKNVGIFNKYNLNGDTLFSKKIVDGNSSASMCLRSLNISSDSCFLITGTVITPSPGYNGNPTYGMFVLKLDTLGNVLWYKKHYPSNLNMQYEGYDIIEDPLTKRIFVTGNRLLLNLSYQGVLWVLDNQGNLIAMAGTNNQFGIVTRSITRRETGNILFGALNYYSNYFGNGINGYTSLLIETDSLGNLVKKIEVDSIGGDGGFGKLICLKNGDLISSGIYESAAQHGLGRNNILRVAKFDQAFNLKWKKYFDNYTNNPNYDATSSLVYTQENEIVFTSDCQYCHDANPVTFMFYRTDTSYCDVNAVACYSYSTVGLNQENSLENEFRVFPNPTAGKLIIQKESNGLVSFKILNSIGQMLLEQKSEIHKIELDLSEFPRGIYFVLITNKNGTLVKKIIRV